MAMTLRLSDEEQELLRRRAAKEGVSMQEVARRRSERAIRPGRQPLE